MLAPKTGRFLRTTHRFLATRIMGILKSQKCAIYMLHQKAKINVILHFLLHRQEKPPRRNLKLKNSQKTHCWITNFSLSETTVDGARDHRETSVITLAC